MQQTGAMRAAYLKPSWCCSPISALPVCTAQHTDYNLLLYFLPHQPSLGVTDPPPPPARSDTEGVRLFPCGGRSPPPRPQPLCRALPERGCHSPRAKDRELGWTVLGAAPGLRAAVRGVRGGRRWAAREPSRAQRVAVPAAAPLGEISAGGARLARPGARCREAAAAGETRHWQPAAGGVRSDSQPRSAAPPCTPPSAAGARRERKRGARMPPRDPGFSAHPREPRLGGERRGRRPAPGSEAGG